MKYICLILQLLGVVSFLVAQGPLVIYNYKTGKVQYTQPRDFGQFVTLRIDNVNTFKYKVTIQGENIEYTTPIPSELQTVFRIQDRYQDQDKGSILGAVGHTTAAVNQMQALARGPSFHPTPTLQNDLNELVRVCNRIVKPTKNVAEIQYTRMELISLSKQKWEDYTALSTQLTSITPPDREKMKRDYMKYIEQYYLAEERYNRALISVKENIRIDSVRTHKAYLLTNYPALDVNSDHIISDTEASTANDSERAAAAASAHLSVSTIRNAEKQIKAASAALEEAYGTFDYEGNGYLELIEDVLTLYVALSNKKNFEVLSAPVQLNTDFTSFKIEVIPMKSNALLPIEHGKTADFRIGTKGGWKADFSIGATLAFGPGMKDSLYFLDTTTTSGRSFLRAGKNNNVVRPGLAAMMHFYPRTGRAWALGGMFGVGADFKAIDDPDISIYLGGSLVLGIREKIMVSAGISFQRVNRNKSGYVLNQDYNSSEISLDQINQRVFVAAPFIGVSYNLTTRRNLTFK